MEEKLQQDFNVRLPQIERGDRKLDNTLKQRTYSQKLDSRNPATACNVSRLKKAVTTDHFKASREEEVKIEQDLTVNLPQIDRKR